MTVAALQQLKSNAELGMYPIALNLPDQLIALRCDRIIAAEHQFQEKGYHK
jgi:hypothetical protein